MRHPFAFNSNLFPMRPVPSHNGQTPSHLGGVAPNSLTVGVRRDIGLTPQFWPSLTIQGGLKQTPRG